MLPGDAREISFGALCVKTGFSKFRQNLVKIPAGPGSRTRPDQLSHLALPCLAYLASHRPRSPCLHLATTARPPSAAGRRGAPLLLLLVQARRARPMRGEVSQASQDLVSTPILTTTSYDELRQPTTNYDELRATTNWLNP